MISNSDHQLWLDYPTGKIPKGTFCKHCARFNARNVACNAILLKDNQVLLVKRAQDPQMGNWDIPGGFLDWDETLQEATSRELREETGLIVKPTDFSFFGSFSDPNNAVGNQVIEMYYVTSKFSGELILQESEVQEAKWLDLKQLPDNVAFDHMIMFRKLIKSVS